MKRKTVTNIGERLNIQKEVAGKVGISHSHLSKIERVYGSEEKIPDVVKKLDEGRVQVNPLEQIYQPRDGSDLV